MSEQPATPHKTKILPILEYLIKTYFVNAKMPQGEEVASAPVLIGEMAKLKTKKEKETRDAIIEWKRKLTPYKRHIFESYVELGKINTETSAAVDQQNAEEMSRGYFRITALLLKLKLYRDSNMPIEKMDLELAFTEQEKLFLDQMQGIDIPFTTGAPPPPEMIVTMRIGDIDKRQLVRGGEVIDENYEEPLRKQIREKIEREFGIERVGDFSGTKKPLDVGDIVKPNRVKEEMVDQYCFRSMSQFFEFKYKALRRATYKPLDIERKETGGYRTKRIKFQEKNGEIVTADSGMISAEVYFMDPTIISKKMVGDISLLSQTLAMGAKKVNTDYFFNVFYHIQRMFADDDQDKSVADAPPAEKIERFDPSKVTDFARHRDRITAEKAVELVNEISKYDIYVFGGHLDLDVYLDCIGIRKKPNILMVQGEGLSSYDYINNLIIVPEYCPPRMTPLDQMLSAVADFRYALWIDSPKNIFDQQGVGFAVIGSKKKAMSKKPLWAIFPTHCSALVKQRAFREHYIKHILSHLFGNGIRSIAGYPIPTVNRIADSLLRQFFNAYVPLLKFKGGEGGGPEPTEGMQGGMDEQQDPDEATADESRAEETAAAPEPEPAPAPSQTAKAAPAAKAIHPDVMSVIDAIADPDPEPAAPSAPPTPATAQPPSAGIACKNCANELPPNSKFCLNCGAPVSVVNKCILCGTELPSGSKFCNECGTQQS
ncbi:MAG: zinc ribbon domain-containing protein [bacterium]